MENALQVAVGASLYGGNKEHQIQILVGDGSTGKSTFLGAIAAALGITHVPPTPGCSRDGETTTQPV